MTQTSASPLSPLSLYFHFPFCEHKCPYCDFNSHVREQIPEDAYVKAYCTQIRTLRAELSARCVETIFFGGGTPSLLSPSSVARILEAVRAAFPVHSACEITLEANPSSAEIERFRGFAACGVNRLSLGVQSFEDSTLRFLGRTHDARQALRALEWGAQCFPRLSFDVILAMPFQTQSTLCAELTRACAIPAEHLCLYHLTLEKATEFGRLARKCALQPLDSASAAESYRFTQNFLAQRGWDNYEISCHARTPRARARHNLVYWQSGDWAGIGPGAHGRLTRGGERVATCQTRNPERWLAQALRGDRCIEKRRSLCVQERRIERIVMGLRLVEGLSIEDCPSLDRALWADLVEAGYCVADSSRLRLTFEGRLRLDSIVAALTEKDSVALCKTRRVCYTSAVAA